MKSPYLKQCDRFLLKSNSTYGAILRVKIAWNKLCRELYRNNKRIWNKPIS